MFNCSPIIPLIISIILSIILVKDSLSKNIFSKVKVTFSFIIIFCLSLISVFYNSIYDSKFNKELFNYLMISITVALIIMILKYYIKSINDAKYFNKMNNLFSEFTLYFHINKNYKNLSLSSTLQKVLEIDENINNVSLKYFYNRYLDYLELNEQKIDYKAFVDFLVQKEKGENECINITFHLKDDTSRTFLFKRKKIYINNKLNGEIFISNIGAQDMSSASNMTAVQDMSLQRLEALVECSDQGIWIKDLKNGRIWLNDYILKKLNISNNISLKEFEKLINNDDLIDYNNTLNSITENNSCFTCVYRIKSEYKYIYVRERSKVIFNDGIQDEIVSYVEFNSSKNFIKTNTILDSLKEENELLLYINDLANQNINYELVYFRISNIPNLNEKYGRSLGTLAMEEYVRTLKEIFSFENGFFRISGLDFVFVITDISKMDLLNKTLKKGQIFNPSLSYGSIKCSLNVTMGLSFSNDAIRPKEIYANTKIAFKKALERGIPYIFYKDINK